MVDVWPAFRVEMVKAKRKWPGMAMPNKILHQARTLLQLPTRISQQTVKIGLPKILGVSKSKICLRARTNFLGTFDHVCRALKANT